MDDRIVISETDNVEIGSDGHKYARSDIAEGEDVIKYGMPIGHATKSIARGEHVHTHNLATNLGGVGFAMDAEAKIDRANLKSSPVASGETFLGYRRGNGKVGIRNDIWVVPTVGCVNSLCERLAAAAGGMALTHPYGCSQLGTDHETTANLLAALCRHPNAGGVLVVALGCENNTLETFRQRVGEDPSLNIRYLRAQDPGDEFERGMELIAELKGVAQTAKREAIPASELVVGLKCGGSDGFSGLTANPLVGRFSDWLVRRGGATVLTEVPEMFGAEPVLMRRCASGEILRRFNEMVVGFREYYAAHGQPCHENPSPGNKAGGITTLEEKSLGCVQKGGTSPVNDVLDYGESVKTRGLTLVTGPGNDLVASTVLAAAGCHLVLFTTGRGTPFGSVVPTVKIATNSTLAAAKPHWIDWDAMADGDVGRFAEKVLAIASGEMAANERTHSVGIAIFKDGVTL